LGFSAGVQPLEVFFLKRLPKKWGQRKVGSGAQKLGQPIRSGFFVHFTGCSVESQAYDYILTTFVNKYNVDVKD
jgi:hypothetical protein